MLIQARGFIREIIINVTEVKLSLLLNIKAVSCALCFVMLPTSEMLLNVLIFLYFA